MTEPCWSRGGLALWDLGAGWVLVWKGGCLVVDPADGFARAWAGSDLEERPLAVFFTGDGPERLGGLYGLLAAEARRSREVGLALVHGMNQEGVPALAAAWRQNDPCSGEMDLVLETAFDGEVVPLAGARLSVHDVGALACVVRLPDGVVVFAGAGGNSSRLVRLLGGAHAVVAEAPIPGLAADCVWIRRELS